VARTIKNYEAHFQPFFIVKILIIKLEIKETKCEVGLKWNKQIHAKQTISSDLNSEYFNIKKKINNLK